MHDPFVDQNTSVLIALLMSSDQRHQEQGCLLLDSMTPLEQREFFSQESGKQILQQVFERGSGGDGTWIPQSEGLHLRYKNHLKSSVLDRCIEYSRWELDSIQSLYVSSERVDDLSFVSRFPGLTTLSLHNIQDVCDFSPLASLRSLRALNLTTVSSLKSLDFLSEVPSLLQLEIEECDGLVDLQGLFGHPRLVVVAIRNCRDLKDLSGLHNIRRLKSLDLSANAALESLAALRDLPQLRSLTVSHSKSLKSLGLFEGMSKVENVDFSLESTKHWDLQHPACDEPSQQQELVDISVLNDLPSLKTARLLNQHQIPLQQLSLLQCRLDVSV